MERGEKQGVVVGEGEAGDKEGAQRLEQINRVSFRSRRAIQ